GRSSTTCGSRRGGVRLTGDSTIASTPPLHAYRRRVPPAERVVSQRSATNHPNRVMSDHPGSRNAEGSKDVEEQCNEGPVHRGSHSRRGTIGPRADTRRKARGGPVNPE